MNFKRFVSVLVAVITLFTSAFADAAIVTLIASKDNTIFEESDFSNGQGEAIYTGRASGVVSFSLRRALISFDIASVVPEGSVITAVTVTMRLTTPRANNPTVGIALHVARMDWGEAGSNAGLPGGSGAPAQAGDATWNHNFYNTSEWTTPGGDFRGTPSAIKSVSTPNTDYTWTSSTLVSDVQGWVNDPESNFGWFVIGNEFQDQTAQRFSSSEAPGGFGPRLTITYTIPEPSSALLGVAGSFVFLRSRRRRPGSFH